VYTEKIQVNKWDQVGYTTRKCCVTILYHAIKNRKTKTITVGKLKITMRCKKGANNSVKKRNFGSTRISKCVDMAKTADLY